MTNVKDVVGDNLEKILSCASARRHGELINATKELVAALDVGDFVAPASTPRKAAGAAGDEAAFSAPSEDATPAGAATPGDPTAEPPVTPGPAATPPRASSGGLSEDQVEALLVPFRLAFESKSPKIIETTLAATQKLIAHGLIRGDADLPQPSTAAAAAAAAADDDTPALTSQPSGVLSDLDPVGEKENGAVASPSPAAAAVKAAPATPAPYATTPVLTRAPRSRADRHAGEVVELICGASEMLEETVELQVLKCLLTAVSSKHLRVRARALLRVVRTCYNIFLGSKSEVNQTTAKASLTQMLTVVFHRLEANSSEAPAPTIVVADLIRPGARQDDDVAAQMVNYVQGFINKVSSDITNIAVAVGASEEDILEISPGLAKQEVTEEEFDNDDTATAGAGRAREDAKTPGSARARGATDGEGDEGSDLETDAFLVFRALCKLAKKPGDLQNVAVVRGKTLSLELLKILLENAGPVFCTSKRFVAAISEYLCDAVVTNTSPTIPTAYQLACSIFLTLLTKFRTSIKAEVGFFFPMLMLKPLEVVHGAPLAPYSQRAILLMCLHKLCADAQLLVDLFVNFDCHLDASNLFERLVNSLVRVAQGLPGVTDLTGAEAAREAVLKAEALECLSGMLAALGGWVDDQLGTGAAAEAKKAAKLAEAAEAAARAADDGESVAPPAVVSEVSGIEKKKASKLEYQEAVALFNKKAKKGIALMQKIGRLGTSPAEIAEFLRATPDLDKSVIGDYLGEREEPNLTVMHAYVDAMDFSGQTLDEAIRKFLEGFRLPGESQKIDRLMEKFAERYCGQNPGAYKSADTAYVLSFSVIMLNTDAHNPQVKNKMTKEGFLRNNRGIDDGQDLPAEHLTELYDRIVNNEIRMKDEDPELLAQKAEANAAGSSSTMTRAMKDMSNRLGVDVLMSLVAGKKMDQMIDTTGFMEEVRARAKRDASGFQVAKDPACVRPMLEVAWPAMLAVFSMSFEATEAASVVNTSLDGFCRAIHLAAVTGMESVRDAFILPLANLTSLHSPSNMRSKNIAAMRALVGVGVMDGNALGASWAHILKAVSRYDRLYSLATGYNDASLFERGSPNGGERKKQQPQPQPQPQLFAFASASKNSPVASSAASKSSSASAMSLFGGAGVSSIFGGGGDDTPFAHLKPKPADESTTSQATGAASTAEESTSSSSPATPTASAARNAAPADPVDKTFLHDLDIEPPPLAVLRELSPDELARIFHISDQLDGEAVVAFVRSLCAVSLEEISSRSPRVYSLTKLVEIAHMNMDRIRLVWSRMWSVLSDFFVEAGCHPNLQVAMYVVDSLRQLSMKFLERGELANYSFQNDFLRPFVVVMRQSHATEIRELIIRCMSQMVLGQVSNIKSGWKSMFMVFTTAAGDENPAVVTLAFETIESIIREHFDHITETDATTFTDCVNCLIAFTNSGVQDSVVSLNALAFLRFCALKLADGSLGNLERVPDSEEDVDGGESTAAPRSSPPRSREREKGATAFTDADVHVFFWFPLLAGLSELTFDPRPEIRRSALEVLFDTLKFHGENFSPGFWARVYDSILLPIFDHVRAGEKHAPEGDASPSNPDQPEADAWLYQTCQHCLELVVDLTAHFYPAVVSVPEVFPRLLALLEGLAARPHEALAACGIGALSRLLLTAGHLFDERAWRLAVGALAGTMRRTLPDLAALADLAPGDEGGGEVGVDARAAVWSVWWRAAREVTTRAATQRLLIQAAAELYFRHGARLDAEALGAVCGALEASAAHAAKINADVELRARLRRAGTLAIAATGLDVSTAPPDPPLTAMEVEARRAALAVLLHLHTAGAGSAGARNSPPNGASSASASASAPTRAKQTHAQASAARESESRLVALVLSVLDEFSELASGSGASLRPNLTLELDPSEAGIGAEAEMEASARARDELAARAPLAVDALKALARFDEASFRGNLRVAFPSLVRLVECERAPGEVSRALSDVFARRVGPIVIRSLEGM